MTSKVKSWILALLPIIGIYSLAGANISNIWLILIVIYGIYRSTKNNGRIYLGKIDKILLLFWVYTIFISIINCLFLDTVDLRDIIVKYVHIACFILIIAVFRTIIFGKNIDTEPFVKVALVSSVFLIVQFILYNFLGIKLYGVSEAFRTNITEDITRPSSFFVEPAHFCRYGMLPLFIVLFQSSSPKKMSKALLISIAVVLSKSSIGYIGLSAIWLLWIFTELSKGKMPHISFAKYLILISSVVMVCIWANSKLDIFSFVIEHISELNMKQISSGNLRVFRGFWIWREEDLLHQIFGVGMANVNNYLIKNGIRTIFDGQLELGCEYMSAVSYVLVMNGIVGLSIFFAALFFLFLKSKNTDKVLIFVFVLLMLSNEEFQSVDFMNMWIYLLVEYTSRGKQKETQKIIYNACGS